MVDHGALGRSVVESFGTLHSFGGVSFSFERFFEELQ